MVTDSNVDHYFKAIGHEGIGRQFALPECNEVAYNLGFLCHEFPNGFTIDGRIVVPPDRNKIMSYMRKHSGVVLTSINNHNHAIVYIDERVWDPKGYLSKLQNYEIHAFIAVEKFKQE